MMTSFKSILTAGFGLFGAVAWATSQPTCEDPALMDCCKATSPPLQPTFPSGQTCPVNSPRQCCTEVKTVVSNTDPGKRVLQCGRDSKYTSEVFTKIDACRDPAEGQCLWVYYENVAGTTYNEVQLELSGSAIESSVPGLYKTYTPRCHLQNGGATADCDIPLDTILADIFPNSPDLCGKTLYMATHAAISNGETCWGRGTNINTKGNWAMYFGFKFVCEQVCRNTCCCPPPTTPPGPEKKPCGVGTGFAYNPECPADGGTCASYISNVGPCNRWGWILSVTREKLNSGKEFQIYVGAGQNKLSSGTLVGVAKLTYDNGVVVEYKLNSPYVVVSPHIHVACSSIVQADKPCSPGQYNSNPQCNYPDLKNPLLVKTDKKCDGGQYYIIIHASVAKMVDSTATCNTPVDCSYVDPPDS